MAVNVDADAERSLHNFIPRRWSQSRVLTGGQGEDGEFQGLGAMLPAMNADPARPGHRVLLVGPRVVALHEMFERRGYVTLAAETGVDGMNELGARIFELVVLELDLVDLTATEFMMAARQGAPRTSFVLVDEPARTTQIVKAWQAGMDGFIAAPIEEDRLFYEMDRHVMRVARPAPDDSSGFEDDSPQTQMTMIEASRGEPDLRAQLEVAQEGLASLAAENSRMTAELRRLAAVEAVLAHELGGALDVSEAKRLRERLVLAQGAELEAKELRAQLQHLTSATDERDERLAKLDVELRAARAAVQGQGDFETRTDGGGPSALEMRLAAVEQERARLQRRADELEAALTATQATLKEAKDAAGGELRAERDAAIAEARDLDEQRGLLQAEIDRLNGIAARHEAAVERAKEASAAQIEKAVTEAVAAERARLERDHAAAMDGAVNAARLAADEKHRAALERSLAAERERLAKREEAAVVEARAITRRDLEAEIDGRAAQRVTAAEQEARNQRERAQDFELQLEEARTRIEFLELDADRVVKEADARVAAAEQAFKKEKLRLVEEKQAAASGSQEAVMRMDALREEALSARRHADEADARVEAMRSEVAIARQQAEDAAARAGAAEAAVVDVMIARDAAIDEARQQEDARERESVRADALVASAHQLEETIASLHAQLRAAEEREQASLAASAAAVAAAAAAEVASERRSAEREQASKAEFDAQLSALRATLAETKEAAMLSTLRAEEHERRADAIDADRTMLIARLRGAEEDVEVRAQQERARAEREATVAAGAVAAAENAERVAAGFEREVKDLKLQVAAAADMITAQQATLAGAKGHEAEITRLAAEVDELRRRLAEVQRPSTEPSALATVRAVTDAVDPLRWGLSSAIDYFSPFEGNDPVLAGHVRHLRLLSAALSRLNPEVSAPTQSG
jgi:hypothetical protein